MKTNYKDILCCYSHQREGLLANCAADSVISLLNEDLQQSVPCFFTINSTAAQSANVIKTDKTFNKI